MRNGKLVAYSGMTTKIRAMKKGLISQSEYDEIANLKTVPDLISYVESRMTFSTYYDFSKIFHFAGNMQKRYLEFYFMKYEIATLKASMRNIMDSRNSTIPVLVDKHFKRHSKLDIDNLINSSNMEEFVNNLSGSVYEKTIRKVYELDSPTLFDYEMSLDLFFFN